MYISQVCYSAACAARVKKEKTGNAARLPRRRIPPPAGLPSGSPRSVPQRHCEAQCLKDLCITTVHCCKKCNREASKKLFNLHILGGVTL
jgi:hypothetical protein